ncbi:MAG TPA: DnaJ C-terminal domain-containing protein [Vicinamibacterales bacterium]|nr:DnaJ C-terminal domain-containing protein [Vicinamibacterales bacterium]
MDFKDYYSTLGVSKTASEKEIKQAFRKLARKHHPDVNPGDKSAETKFKEINEAYEVLGDPAKRKKYDELGANWRAYEQAGARPGGAGFDPSQFSGGGWNAHFGGGGPGGESGYRTMTPEEMNEMFGDDNPFSDFFQTFFGGAGAAGEARTRGSRGRATRAPQAHHGRDIEQEIELPLEDVYHGTTRRFAIQHDGQTRTVDVRIPAGVGEGARVRVAGEGEQGSGGARAGDLYLRIRTTPHGQFERKGRDLYTRVPVPLTTAVLGGEADVKTLGGKSLRLKIPQATQHAQVFRLKGHGMPPTGKGGETGDLYATVDVLLPRELTPEQRKHFEALQKLEKDAKHSAA